MAQRSAIGKLPHEIRDQVHRLIRDGVTIDAIVERLEALGAEVSRSSVGRYKQKYEGLLERYREAQEVAAVWVRKLGEDPQGDVGQLCAEMLKTVAFQTLANMADTEAEKADPKAIMMLAKSIKDLEGAAKISAERELKVRKAVAAELLGKLDAAEKDAEVAGEPGLSAARIAQLRRDFLGVRAPAAAR